MAKTRDLAAIFDEMADALEFLGDNPFRINTYRKAAEIFKDIDADINSVEELEEILKKRSIHGIGESTLEKVEEFIKTGKIKKHEELKQKVPSELLELMKVPHIGPKTLKIAYDKLNVRTRKDFLEALENKTLESIKGFGPKKIENIKKGLEIYEKSKDRMFILDAWFIAKDILNFVKSIKEVKQFSLAGSLLRGKETIGDIDILVSCEKEDAQKVHKAFLNYEEIMSVLGSGETKTSVILKNSRQVDIRTIEPKNWGAALQYFTGSKEHNVRLRDIAKEKGYKISEYGIFDAKTDKRLGGEKEKDIYALLGMDVPPPEIRENKGEIELALKHSLPKLLELKDIKGDTHLHTNWSDGADTIYAMVEKAFSLGYEYIVIGDHSKSLKVAKGLDEKRYKEQWDLIEELNKEYNKKGFYILKGAEVDILEDGSLDLPESFLEGFDYVVASIHTHFKLDNTKRIIKACESRFVNQIGHPHGRAYGYREGYPLNFEDILKVAKETNTALELNTQRADISPEQVRECMEKDLFIAVVTDAHSQNQLDYMEIGVKLARRGWAVKEKVVNAFSLKDLKAFVKRKR